MEQKLNIEEYKFLEYLQGGELPKGRESWIILKAQIELATMQAYEQAINQLCGYYGNNELAVSVTF